MKILGFCQRQKRMSKIGFRAIGKDQFGQDGRAEALPDLSVSYPIFSKIAYSVNNFLSVFNKGKKL